MPFLLKRILAFMLLILLLSVNVVASPNINIQIAPPQRPIPYIPISYENIRENRGLERWYQRYYQTKGVYSRKHRGSTYVLISAGQRPTGGYRVILSDIRRVSRGTVFITARVIRPPRNMIVTQAITYPHLLIRIDDPRITRVEGTIGEFRSEEESEETLKEQVSHMIFGSAS